MKKRLLNGILLGTAATLCAGGFAACKGSDGNNGGAEKTQIEEVYANYIAYAEENGETPLSYEEWLDSIKGEKGERGEKGEKGESGAAGKDGKDGTNGTNGKDGADGKTPYIGANGNWWIGTTDTGVKAAGTNGKDGADGKDGKDGINGTNGKDGADGKDGKDGKDGINGTNGKDGVAGKDGEKGLSAYELYKKYHPDYKKSEQEWVQELLAGYLHTITITLNVDGGEIGQTSIKTAFGSFATIEKPVKSGYDFIGWELNGSMIDVNTYVFFADCTLKAVWRDSVKAEISLNADGGVVSVAHITVEYGKEYTLPVPSKEKQTFAGWFYENTEIAQSGIWNYTHENIELTAKWNKTNIYANLSVDEAYGAVEKNKVTLAIGDYFVLPVPTSLKEGESFQGWYYGDEKVTDSDGKSLKKCLWDSTVTLTAEYYTEIGTIYEFMNLQGKDLAGKYVITQDLDFKGLGVNYIKSISGTFDGGGHTLKNFTLSTGAIGGYSGLFREVKADSKICNLTLENVRCNEEYASGLAGFVSYETTIENITVVNSFHDEIRSVLVGGIGWSGYQAGVAKIKNIAMIDSGENASAYCVYDFFSYDTSDTSKLGMTISNVRIQGKGNRRQVAAGIIYSNSCNIDVDNYILESDIDYGVCYSMGRGSMKVRNSEIRSKTKIAWSEVDELYDSIHTGTTQNWGAKKSVRCIDAGSEWGTYDLGDISSSIVLYPDANGVYTYYSSSGTKATFTGIDLIDKNLFASMLGFDEQIWNLDNIDVKNGIYPTIRGAEK